MNPLDVFRKTLSLDLSDVSISIEDAKDLLALKDAAFAKQYLLSKGARELDTKIDRVSTNEFKNPKKDKKMIKPCYLGEKGKKAREEAFDIINNIIVEDPIRPGCKMNYTKAAIALNKNGYRTLRERKWTKKSVQNFYHHITTRSTLKNRVTSKVYATNKTSDTTKAALTNIDIIKNILDSNLAKEIQFFLIKFLSNNHA